MIGVLHLDLNIVEHCNFSCTSCSHASPLNKPWEMSLEEIERDLNALKPFFRTTNLNIVGGEPTLHHKLLDVMRLVKRIRIDDQTHLITNGSLLPKMGDDFWSELEFLKVSVYGRLNPEIPKLVKERSKEYGFGIEMTEFKDFYLQLRPEPGDGSQFSSCHWKSDCYTVHRGYFYLCPQSAFFPKAVMGLDRSSDGIALEGLTEERLRSFMDRTEPLESCRVCMANEMRMKEWGESPKSKWVDDSTMTRWYPTADERERMVE